MIIYLEIVRKGEAVIDRNERSILRSGALAVRDQFLHHQDVGFVSIAVEYP